MARNWTKIEVHPEEILDGTKSLDGRMSQVMTMDLVPTWVRAEEYLSWARAALEMGSPFGHDAAVCYAKRAVCRLIDSLMHYNHFRKWAGGTYPSKIEMLKKVGIEVKSVVHELSSCQEITWTLPSPLVPSRDGRFVRA
jgi:hypothetical protein